MERKIYHQFYFRHISCESNTCYYCGESANTVDHCPPISKYLVYPEFQKILVRACRECNVTLSNKDLPTLESRTLYLLNKYQRKYRKLYNLPVWEDEELAELSPKLRKIIENAKTALEAFTARLNHLSMRNIKND